MCWGPDVSDVEEATSDHISSPIKVCYDAIAEWLLNPFSFIIAGMDADIVGMRVGYTYT
jgi:hypothetical protein